MADDGAAPRTTTTMPLATSLRRAGLPALAALLLPGCRGDDAPARPAAAATAPAGRADGAGPRFVAEGWRAPEEAEIPNDSLGASIRRGLALFVHTTDSLPRHAPGRITCANCHLGGGRSADASPITGAHARYPRYLERAGSVVNMVDRVNYCLTRSLAGTRLPADSREMQDFLAYIAWLSRGVPVGERLRAAEGLPPMPPLTGDATRGEGVFRARCETCHGADGAGDPARSIPALWGPKSYSIGASMAREGKAASFIWHNMPLGAPKSLTPQEAFDVAAYVNARPRPDLPQKEKDWPNGGAPADVPYATAGHAAHRPPATLLPRANPAGALVPRPASVRRRAED